MDSALVQATPVDAQTLEAAPPRKKGKGNTHASGYDILRCLQLRDEGLSAQEIGQRLTPKKHQTTVSAILRKWGRNTVADAKRLLEAAAADMAVDVAERGRPQDKVNALKGLGVLNEQPQAGLIVQIGRGSQVKLGIALSPPALSVESESL